MYSQSLKVLNPYEALRKCSLLEDDETICCKEALQDAPTADAVEVVRCKDCKHSWIHPSGYICCHRSGLVDHDMTFSPDDFCSYGERRSDNAAD